MKTIQGVIWDMDGIIVDSEAQWPAEMQRFFGSHGKEYTAEDAATLMGSSSQIWFGYIKQRCELDESWTYERVTEAIRDRMHEWYKTDATPIAGALELIHALHEHGIKQAIASGSDVRTIQLVVERFGLSQYLGAWVSGEEVAVPKPAPDVFLEAARRIDIAATACTGIEDSPNGTRAIKAAGMRAIAIPHHLMPNHPDYQQADIIRSAVAEVVIADFLDVRV